MPRSSGPERLAERSPRATRGSPNAAEPAAVCERHAVALLARREHSRLELERKLAARGHPPELIDTTLDGLERAGLLDERRFASAFVTARAARGLGPARITAELSERGIARSAAAAALAAAELDFVMLAAAARLKRFGPGAPQDLAERARQTRFLAYRGFRGDEIAAALEVAADSD